MICVLSSSLAGCDGESDGVPLEEFSAEASSAFCDWAARCRLLESAKTCEMNGSVEVGQLVAAIKAGRVVYDAKQASSCIAELREASCGFSLGRQYSACAAFAKPVVARGGRCSDSDECLSGNCEQSDPRCLPDNACCPGTCAGANLKSDLPNGTTCFSDTECVSAFCHKKVTVKGESGVCESLPKLNEPCAFKCESGLWCEFSSRTCKRIPNTGESCTDVCNLFSDWCSDNEKCEPRVEVGKPCRKDEGCLPWATCSNSVCVALPKIGESCRSEGESGATSECAHEGFRDIECVSGKCTSAPSEPVCP
jgi:hypothetical protein